jgi:hypothetical protein
MSRPPLGTIQLPNQWLLEALSSSELKRPECKAEILSPTNSAKFYYAFSFTSILPYVFMMRFISTGTIFLLSTFPLFFPSFYLLFSSIFPFCFFVSVLHEFSKTIKAMTSKAE